MDRYQRRQRWDRIGAGVARSVGVLVLLLVAVLMGYLLFAVVPIFWPDQPTARSSYAAQNGASVLLAFSPDETRATRLLANGQLTRFAPDTGFVFAQLDINEWLSIDAEDNISGQQLIDDQQQEYLLVIKTTGQGVLLQWVGDALTREHRWASEFELGEGLRNNIVPVSVAQFDEQLHIAAVQQQAEQLVLNRYLLAAQQSSGESLQVTASWPLPEVVQNILILNRRSILLSPESGGLLQAISNTIIQAPELPQNAAAVPDLIRLRGVTDTPVPTVYRQIEKLSENALLAATVQGDVQQLFLSAVTGSTKAGSYTVAERYQCQLQAGSSIRINLGVGNWFACLNSDAQVALFYFGRSQPAWQSQLDNAVSDMTLTAEQLLIDDGSGLFYLRRVNEPPLNRELLWEPVWYPGYAYPAYSWQPVAAPETNPKYSVTPLLFGTLKSAVFAILFGIPFAVIGAIYTALILPRHWQERIKPVVEMLEAMPTVIIGFLAAVWLAPVLQNHLLIFFLFVFGLPPALILLGYGWSKFLSQRVDPKIRRWLPVCLLGLSILLLAAVGWLLEYGLFAGQLSAWLETQWGWTYDLRNALVVGVALGIAITPTIFALSEDALTAVPQYLRHGAVALGASRWQAIWQVIVPCAASGLLAAVLIGLGRALGETMIVLMAASNTPLLEASPLRGLQAIAPTLAVEMPEAEPGGLHFRVLLLCALVLFVFTLLANTLAELIRERLRKRYQL